MARILVTPRSVTTHGHPSLERLRAAGHEIVLGPAGRQPDVPALGRLLPGCAGYLAGVEAIPADVLQAAAGLRVISRNGTGIDNVDLAEADRLGIAVLRADGANAQGVAELTIGLIFALARGIPATDAGLKRGEWPRLPGIELAGRTLGLIGCGRIGQLVTRMAVSLGMNVVGYDPFAPASLDLGPRFRLATQEEVLRAAEILSLHCPAADGRPLLDAASFAAMRAGVLVVNTARAELIDPHAAQAALDDGRLGGLALDVFPEEPPNDLELVRHPRVVATAHIGGFTAESIDRAMNGAVNNLLRVLADGGRKS